jgi:pyruvate dehydrogenase E2 component (dihydrolipoamide acetyltransferase)
VKPRRSQEIRPRPEQAQPPVKERQPCQIIEVKVPDIGDFKDVPVIGVLVKSRRHGEGGGPAVTLESDKATMEVPSPAAGVVKEIKVKVGDKVSEGTLVLCWRRPKLRPSRGSPAPARTDAKSRAAAAPPAAPKRVAGRPSPSPPPPKPIRFRRASPCRRRRRRSLPAAHKAHASPSVRRFARELGVDVGKVKGTGRRAASLQQTTCRPTSRARCAQPARAACAAGGGAASTCCPGRRSTSPSSARSKSQAAVAHQEDLRRQPRAQLGDDPARHQFDEADITDLEALRVQLNKENEKSGNRPPS